jgi:hypothetical protein
MHCSVAVMAHPRRARFVSELVEQLDRQAVVIWDEKGDRWDTGRRALLAHEPDATHHLVIQDDAIPSRDLVAGVERALAYVPARSPMCLYVGKVKPFRRVIEPAARSAADQGASWLVMKETYWGPGIVIPVGQIPEVVAWGDTHPNLANYDRRIGRWYLGRSIPVWYPWPSLVEHRDSPSLVKGRAGGRHAHNFIGVDRSALEVDWSGPVVQVVGK